MYCNTFRVWAKMTRMIRIKISCCTCLSTYKGLTRKHRYREIKLLRLEIFNFNSIARNVRWNWIPLSQLDTDYSVCTVACKLNEFGEFNCTSFSATRPFPRSERSWPIASISRSHVPRGRCKISSPPDEKEFARASNFATDRRETSPSKVQRYKSP